MEEPLVKMSTTFHPSGEPQCAMRILRLEAGQSQQGMMVPEFDFESLDPEKCLLLSQEGGPTRGEIKLSAVPGWCLVSVTTVSTCRRMEVFSSSHQYLCSMEADLLDEVEDTQVFVGSLLLSEVSTGGEEAELILRPPGSLSSLWIYGMTVAVAESKKKRSLPAGHFDLDKVNSLLADQPLSAGAERFKHLFESFQRQPSPLGGLPPPGLPLIAGLGSLAAAGGSGPPTFAAMVASAQLMGSLQQEQLPAGRNPPDQLQPRSEQQMAAAPQLVQPELSDAVRSALVRSAASQDGAASAEAARPMPNPQAEAFSAPLLPCGEVVGAGVAGLEAAIKAYVDAKFQDLEMRLLDRLAGLEQTIGDKLDQLIARR